MNLNQYDLIGRNIEIVGSRNKSLVGVKGKVVDETKNLIILDNGKKILKSVVEIKIIDDTSSEEN